MIGIRAETAETPEPAEVLRDTEDESEMEGLRKELQSLRDDVKTLKEASVGRSANRNARARKQEIDPACSKAVHKVYHELSQHDDFIKWNFDEGFYSDSNRHTSRKLRRELRGVYGKETWKKSTAKDAIHQYWKSKRDDNTRRKNLKFQEHRNSLRSQQRMKRKLARRRKALASTQLSDNDREKAKRIFESKFGIQCMSSEESCADDDIEPGPGPKPRKIRRLAWERTKLYNIKKAIDEQIRKNLTPVQKRLTARVVISEEKSTRAKPQDIPAWAAKE